MKIRSEHRIFPRQAEAPQLQVEESVITTLLEKMFGPNKGEKFRIFKRAVINVSHAAVREVIGRRSDKTLTYQDGDNGGDMKFERPYSIELKYQDGAMIVLEPLTPLQYNVILQLAVGQEIIIEGIPHASFVTPQE